jgi:hypothetical protein
VVQAGTATSVRTREEEQSFNILEVEPGAVTLGLKRWTGAAFDGAVPTRFVKEDNAWKRAEVLADPAEA